ncbi:unnamed protein product [Adineta steineri]|uniref:Uncharacterized protein n=1 Tax=Adineta steineri TaxID=433720 RepID=A0A813NTV9_9BILA|nr:unnamed protein product [Adineta steineri]CAF0740490.1 unnamed protein product [Adineta steineri]CAF0750436.1 unnamed protein product [Adineta steineri]
MCNGVIYVTKYKRIFQYFILFYLIYIFHTKSIRRSDVCNRFLVINDCDYFPCLDAQYPCGRDSHLTRFSYDLCLLSTKKYVSQLTKNAQIYFNHTNTCVMKSINDQLIEQRISGKFTCTDLHELIFQNYLSCFQNKQRDQQLVTMIDFCSIMCENLQTMINLFLNLNNEFFNFYHLLMDTGKNCGANIHEGIIPTIPSILMAICLDRKNVRLKQDITSVMFNPRYEPTDYDWTTE